jgi:hypothetical protein
MHLHFLMKFRAIRLVEKCGCECLGTYEHLPHDAGTESQVSPDLQSHLAAGVEYA